jgi:hypothetical protein
MTLDDWYDAASEDADRRGVPELKPLIDVLRQATRQLRDADWNDDARGPEADAAAPHSSTRP